jgi:hypothetical protein
VLVNLRLSSGSPERPPKRAGGRVPARHLAGYAFLTRSTLLGDKFNLFSAPINPIPMGISSL